MVETSTQWETRVVNCNLCGNDQVSLLWYKDRFRYVRCVQCGLVYVNPQLLPAEIERIYDTGYASKSESKPLPLDFLVYQPILDWAARYKQQLTFLDIGCFKGHLLLAAREQGWSVLGIEISQKAVEYARKEHGLDVFLGPLPEASYPPSHFDVAIMQDVVEHLSSPKLYLQEVFRVLRPGGGIYIETPNFDSATRYVLGKEWSVFFPWHQYYFTPRTLKKMLEEVGFVVRKVRCVGLGPLSRYDALRAIVERKEMVSASRRRLKSIAELPIPYFKKTLLSIFWVSDLPFRFLSLIGIHIGTKMIVFAEKPCG